VRGAPAAPGSRILVPLLLSIFLLAGYLSLRGDSATFDETAHLAAGYAAADAFDFRLSPEHPPLARIWCALPLLLDRRIAADYGTPAWRGRPIEGSDRRTGADPWVFGYEFLNGRRDEPVRLDPARALIPARLMMLALGGLLGLVVFAWAREMWGRGGGLLALFLYALSPSILAHARLVTTDLPAALGFTAALWTLWRFHREPGYSRGIQAAAALAVAPLLKFSLLVLWPISLVLLVAWSVSPLGAAAPRARRAGMAALLVVFSLALTVIGLWAGYGFRYAATGDPAYVMPRDEPAAGAPEISRLIPAARDRRLLPEAWLSGLTTFLSGAKARLGYLNGRTSLVGSWLYFPEAFLLKTPPALLVIVLLLAAGFIARRGRGLRDLVFLAIPCAIYFGIALRSALNLGHRHLLPLEPILCVAAGALPAILGATGGAARGRRILVAVLLAGYALSFAAATPGYLSYFNFLAGGARGGARYLLDSNLDWGQDLARLGTILRERGAGEIDLAYFGTADPSAYGIRFRKIRLVHDFHPEMPDVAPGSGEWMAVSVNFLHGLYLDDDGDLANSLLRRGWASRKVLEEWVDLRGRALDRGEAFPSLGDWLVNRGALSAERREEAVAALLSTKLRRIAASREPVARAGDSILVYRLTEAGGLPSSHPR